MWSKAHYESQKNIAKVLVGDLEPLWRILDFHRLRETTAPWLKAVRPVVERGYLTSQFVAAEHYHQVRRIAAPGAPDLEISVPNPLGAFGFHDSADRSTQLRITVAMKVTGPVTVDGKATPGLTDTQIADIMQTGFNKSCGAAVRIALNGGRGMMRTLVEADQQAKGVQAVAADDACKSCRFLAETPLFKGIHTAKQLDAVAVGHDWCWCSVTPLF